MIAQTRGVRTDAGQTGKTETSDEHCHQCQKLSAATVARLQWSTVSKAADKYRRIRAAVSPRSTACSMSDSNRRTAVSVECRIASMTSSVVSGEKLRKDVPGLTRLNVGGGASLVVAKVVFVIFLS